jgi:MFS transporter, ACS family, glucarate transporter
MTEDGMSASTAKPFAGNLRWWVMGALIAPITFVMSLDRTAMAVAAPIIQKEFGFTLTQMSLILTSFTWAYALFQVPGGWLAERAGPRRALFWANLLWSVLTALTPWGFGLFSFVIIRALLGVGQAADWPSSVLAIRQWFPERERGRGNSILLGGLYFGPMVGPPVTVAIATTLGWHAAFYIYGLVGVVLGLAWWWGYRDNPHEHPAMTREEARMIEAERTAEPEAGQPGLFGRCLSSGRFWAIGLQYFLLVLIQSFFTTWLPTYLVQERGFRLASMGIFASLPAVALFLTVFAAGAGADAVLKRTGSVWMARVPFAVAGFVISAAGLILASRTPDTTLMMVLLCISLGAIGLTQVAIWPTTQDLGRGATGVVAGWTNFLGNAGGAAGPLITAWLVGATGSWSSALLIIALAGVLGAVLWFFIHPERPLEVVVGEAPLARAVP